jgi:hypothetical protein
MRLLVAFAVQLFDFAGDAGDENLERGDGGGQTLPDVMIGGLGRGDALPEGAFVETGPAQGHARVVNGCRLLALSAVHGPL